MKILLRDASSWIAQFQNPIADSNLTIVEARSFTDSFLHGYRVIKNGIF
jgi:hypothetical protein